MLDCFATLYDKSTAVIRQILEGAHIVFLDCFPTVSNMVSFFLEVSLSFRRVTKKIGAALW
jgi:hypothetical protein